MITTEPRIWVAHTCGTERGEDYLLSALPRASQQVCCKAGPESWFRSPIQSLLFTCIARLCQASPLNHLNIITHNPCLPADAPMSCPGIFWGCPSPSGGPSTAPVHSPPGSRPSAHCRVENHILASYQKKKKITEYLHHL